MIEFWGIIYVRLSRDEEGQTSTADQEHHCRLLLNRLGIPDERIIVFREDPGTSGFKDVPLPERDKFMAAAGPNKVAASWMIDRISRKGMEDSGKLLRQFKEASCRYVTVADGVDTFVPGSNLNAGIRAIMANSTFAFFRVSRAGSATRACSVAAGMTVVGALSVKCVRAGVSACRVDLGVRVGGASAVL